MAGRRVGKFCVLCIILQANEKERLLIWFRLFFISKSPQSRPLVYRVFRTEELLHWCLDHGARVDYSYSFPDQIQPLLDIVGRGGTVSTFKLLMEQGAKLGPRTLHLAVQHASSGKFEGMEMVRFLVEESGCEVNEMDMPADKQYGGYFGTPLNYAGHAGGAVEVVKYLLEVSLAM